MIMNWKVILSTTALFLCMENTIESMEGRGNEQRNTRKKNKTNQIKKQSQAPQNDNKLIKEIKEDIGNENHIYGDFTNQLVKGMAQDHEKYDHQGHIIPQNMLSRMLLDDHKRFLELKRGIEEEHKESGEQELRGILLEQLPRRIEEHWHDFNFSHFLPDFHSDLLNTVGGPSEILSKVYSRVIWNPGNICRAPEDKSRPNNQPGEKIDDAVLQVLHHENAHMYGLLNEAIAALNQGDVVSFMNLWHTILLSFEGDGQNGYYRFNWKLDDHGKFVPGD